MAPFKNFFLNSFASWCHYAPFWSFQGRSHLSSLSGFLILTPLIWVPNLISLVGWLCLDLQCGADLDLKWVNIWSPVVFLPETPLTIATHLSNQLDSPENKCPNSLVNFPYDSQRTELPDFLSELSEALVPVAGVPDTNHLTCTSSEGFPHSILVHSQIPGPWIQLGLLLYGTSVLFILFP